MKILIKNKIFDWKSDFLNEYNKPGQKKWAKKREDYFCTEVIGGTKCFVKRAENGFEGAAIFQKLVGKNVEGIPKTYGFGEAIENNKKVQYLVTEFLAGDTLDVVLNNGKKVNLNSFSTNLINSIYYLHSIGFWHSDVNGDNIFVSTSGKTYLIDIDSAVESHIKPTHISNKEGALTTLSNQIGSYALKYYKKHLSKPTTFDYGKIPGVNLNFLQVLFLTYQLKYFQEQKIKNPSLFWKKSTFKGLNIEDEIRKINPQYADSLFKAALLKPLHKEVVNNLNNEIIKSSVKTAPDTIKLKKMKELKELKVKYANLERLVTTHTTERSKLLGELDILKKAVNTNKGTSSSGWAWFWGIAATITTGLGIFFYNGYKEANRDSELQNSRYRSELAQKIELDSNLRRVILQKEGIEALLDELSTNIAPYHKKEIYFNNYKDNAKGTSFYNASVTYIAPTIVLYSLREGEVEVSYKRRKPNDEYATYSDGVTNQKDRYYIYKKLSLNKGLNEVMFSYLGHKDTGKWRSGIHEYTFYIDNNQIATKKLYIK